jgi:hypothetical protein
MSKTMNNLDTVTIQDEEYRVLLKNGSDHPIFLIQIVEDVEYSMSFEVYDVTSWEMDFSPRSVEQYLKGHIKWDGCSHVWVGDNDGYLHLCGKHYWERHAEVMLKLFEVAENTIERFDPEIAE